MFMISSIIQALFFLSKFSPIWVCKKRNDKESMFCLTWKPSQSFFVYRIQSKESFLSTVYKAKKKITQKEKGKWRIEQKMKRILFNCSLYGD